MQKVFRLKNLGCANCASKMESAIKKLKGVEDARISFFSQTLKVTAADDAIDALKNEMQSIVKSIEPDCTILFH